MPTQNKEVLRIRKLKPRPPRIIHANQFMEHPITGEVKNVRQYHQPPKDFTALRAQRKARWKALRMFEGVKHQQKENVHA